MLRIIKPYQRHQSILYLPFAFVGWVSDLAFSIVGNRDQLTARVTHHPSRISLNHVPRRPQTTLYVSQCVSPWSLIHKSPQEVFALEVGNSEPQSQSALCHDQSREVLPLEVVWTQIAEVTCPEATLNTHYCVMIFSCPLTAKERWKVSRIKGASPISFPDFIPFFRPIVPCPQTDTVE
jgi:hypothetical protein